MTTPARSAAATPAAYDLMWVRWLSGRDRDHWRRVHDRLNGVGARDQSVPPPRPPVAESVAAMKRVKECPHRSRDEGCGCNGHRCALGKGRAGPRRPPRLPGLRGTRVTG
jgi:hypothetical protein